jgi:hypothetical protein
MTRLVFFLLSLVSRPTSQQRTRSSLTFFILADDLGLGELSCYGHQFKGGSSRPSSR